MLIPLAVAVVVAQSDPSEWVEPPTTPAPVEPVEEEPGEGVRVEPKPESQPETAPTPVAPAVKPPEPAVELPSPDPRRWTWPHFALALMGSFGDSGYFAVRLEGGAVIGFARRMQGTANRAMGPTLGIAADLLAAKIRIGVCGTAGICGSRYQGGLALRGAWNWGVIDKEGIVAPIHSLFLQAVGFLSSNSVPSAPLFPGSTWGEHGVRFDLGLTSGYLRGSTWPRPGAFVIGGGIYLALSLEWLIAVSDPDVRTGRVRFGVSLGVGI